MGIVLKPVTAKNWYACTKLRVKKEQEEIFPAPVVYWIAESKYVCEFELRAIHKDDLLVGFLVFCNKPDEEGNFWIPAIMIDQNFQGKGFGKAAMHKLIETMAKTDCEKIMIGHRPNNLTAGHLYESLGFLKVSNELRDGEVVRLLQL
ncbi:GNAT family N-acetyltransferase [Paenibacillus sp. XY044]|uniref:GNAT family N-acetyltransferase n=1 Tax=Paenibacillus sp. XY044 TaxID=2026089 RepID=UPI000B98C768|nr:GNAT family N-acetyltransferase [Paenibacillus sp. XY044]OZB98848.1 spermidine acetyltransferase [Paenibacillus sp. XY044]